MAARYTLKVITDFAAAHLLRDYPGECSRLHGHNWKVEVEVVATALDEVGMGLDFKAITRAAKEVIATLDHRHLNATPPFDEINPTAENIAAHNYAELSRMLNGARTRVGAVTLWETERACVRYSEEPWRLNEERGRERSRLHGRRARRRRHAPHRHRSSRHQRHSSSAHHHRP